MNGKKSKLINKQSKVILIEWFKTLMPEEESNKISIDNCMDFVPKQTHFYANRTIHLNSYNPKWIKNKIKKIINLLPFKPVQLINLKDIEWIANKK